MTIEPRAGYGVVALVAAPHAAALLTALLLPVPVAAGLACAGTVIVSAAHAWRCHVRGASGRAVRWAVWEHGGQWWLGGVAGEGRAARLLPASYVGERWLVLNFELLDGGGRRTMLLGPGSVAPETLRQLRVRLNLETDKQP